MSEAVRVSNVWAGVTFSDTFSAAPVVLSQVQSNDDPHWVKTRGRDSTGTSPGQHRHFAAEQICDRL